MAHEPAAAANVAAAFPTHKTCTKCGNNHPLSEYSPQKMGKYGRTAQCKACFRAYNKAHAAEKKLRDQAWRSQNPGTWRGYTKQWRDANPDKVKAYTDANRERQAEISRATYEGNKEARLVQMAAWRKANPDKVSATAMRHIARKMQACPPWADHDAIAAVYAEAARLTKETGIPHQVDHIIPLQGKNVCGLHVHQNLRAIPATENQRKSNTLLLQPHEVIE